MQTENSVFLTGEAGSGKSFVLREFLKSKNSKVFPSLASTGAAAVLIGGRTFHSFMGLGILEGGRAGVLEKASKDKRLQKRLNEAEGFVIDEVSMLSGETLSIAENVCRLSRQNQEPWGGLKVIAVGDFAQLPPVEKNSVVKNWAFEHPVWHQSHFFPVLLKQNMRIKDATFAQLLNSVRIGEVSVSVKKFLDSRTPSFLGLDDGDGESLLGTRLYSRRSQAEAYNFNQLSLIDSVLFSIETEYNGSPEGIKKIQSMAPIPPVLHLKTEALVMLRVNDPKGRFVNGSTGIIKDFSDDSLLIELLSGRMVSVEKTSFQMLNAEGQTVAVATNFPISLAYAVTIHKAQGLTLDRVFVDLRNLWEPGQAYVAISRVKEAQHLFVEGWDARSIRADEKVRLFYSQFYN